LPQEIIASSLSAEPSWKRFLPQTAQEIIKAQRQEIAQIDAWLAARR
jgi:uncharacterized protein (DUF305 family)